MGFEEEGRRGAVPFVSARLGMRQHVTVGVSPVTCARFLSVRVAVPTSILRVPLTRKSPRSPHLRRAAVAHFSLTDGSVSIPITWNPSE